MTKVERASEPARFGGLALQVVRGPLGEQRISVESRRFRIGADPDNDLSIATDEYISGHHATIQSANGEWRLIDQGSKNGTYLDGQRVEQGTGEVLRRGQSIQVGNSEFQVILVDEQVIARASSAPTR
jgi:pSer/pThr/pTyr-binding forkhead associated (FHA) protein